METELWCEKCSHLMPSFDDHLGHTVAGYLHRQGISVIPYLDDWLVHHLGRQTILPPIPATSVAGVSGFQTKFKDVRTGSSSRYSVSGPSLTPRNQSSGDNIRSQQTIHPVSFCRIISTGVPVYGVHLIGLQVLSILCRLHLRPL